MKRKVELVQDSATGLETSNGINVAEVTGAVVDNAIVRFNGTSGQVQNSSVTIDDSGTITAPKLYVGATNGLNGTAEITNSNYGNLASFRTIAGDGVNPYINITSSNQGITFEENGSAYGALMFKTSSTERMRIDSSGNVGIGVTPSPWTNYKAIEIGAVGNAILGISNSTVTTNNAYWQSGSWKYATTGAANRFEVGAGSGKFQWFTAQSGTAGNPITWTTAMTLGANGNLLVGTTTDNGVDKLQVDGSLVASNFNRKIVYSHAFLDSSTIPTIDINLGNGYVVGIFRFRANRDGWENAFYEYRITASIANPGSLRFVQNFAIGNAVGSFTFTASIVNGNLMISVATSSNHWGIQATLERF